MHLACPSFIRTVRVLATLCSLLIPFCAAASQVDTPAKEKFSSRLDAFIAASAFAAASNGSVLVTTGTPSMEPLIHGKTYAVIQKVPFETIEARDILVYVGRPAASSQATQTMLHRAVLHDSYGWVMSGDNNRWSESWDRVTPRTYIGRVVALFEFPQA